MITIYEYDRIAGAENSLTYMAAVRQPLAGGYNDDDEGRRQSSSILVPVHQVETIEQAREWIHSRINQVLPMSFIPGVTRPAYAIYERPHPQALLCITAEGEMGDGED